MPEIIVKLGDNIVQKYFFVKETMSIGRAPDNEIVIENLAISRSHAMLKYEDERYLIVDLGSSNGTHVNGVRVKKTEIMDRDVIAIGKYKLYFYDAQAGGGEQPLPSLSPVDQTMLVEATPTGQLVITKGRQKDQSFELVESETHLGKGAENQIRVTDWFVSKRHAVIERRGGGYYLRDLNSWRHTTVNGNLVDEVCLEDGDEIGLGPSVAMTFQTDLTPLKDIQAPARVPVELPENAPDANVQRATEAPPEAEPDAEPEAEPEAGEHTFRVEGSTAVYECDEPLDEPLDEPAANVDNSQDAPVEERIDDEPQNGESEQGLEQIVADMAEVSCQVAGGSTVDHPLGTDSGPAPEAKSTGPTASESVDSSGDAVPTPAEGEVQMWERALSNKSPVIRKQAARRLKQLTGKDYEY